MLVSKFGLENQFRIWSEVRRVQYTLRFWLQVPMGEIGQDRTLLPATCMVLVLICRTSKVSREEQEKKPGVRRVTQKSELLSEIFGF